MHQRHLLFDLARRLDVGDAVVVVLLHARCDGEDIRIENNVLWREADLFRQQLVGALANRNLALNRIGLAHLVEGHHDYGGSVAQNLASLFEERPFAFLHADRVDDRLALQAFEAGLDDGPFRAVDHHRHPANVGFRRNEIEERRHRLFGIEQAFVHVDVDDLCARLDLLARDGEGTAIVALLDQLTELGGARNVRALAYVDERLRCIGGGHCSYSPVYEWFEARETQFWCVLRKLTWFVVLGVVSDVRDVVWRRSAAAADNVDQSISKPRFDLAGHVMWVFIIFAHGVRQARIRISRNARVRYVGEFGDVRPHQLGTERAIQSDRKRPQMTHRIPESFRRLARQSPPRAIRDRA